MKGVGGAPCATSRCLVSAVLRGAGDGVRLSITVGSTRPRVHATTPYRLTVVRDLLVSVFRDAFSIVITEREGERVGGNTRPAEQLKV